MKRNGFGDENLPMFYSDEGGMMIANTALGNNGEGGGSSGLTMGDLTDAFLANGSTNYFEGIDFTQFGADPDNGYDKNGKKINNDGVILQIIRMMIKGKLSL